MDVFPGKCGDDLVRIHVRRRAGARLEDIDRKLIVQVAGGDAIPGLGDSPRLLLLEQAELRVDLRSRGLDPSEPACNRRRNRLA